MPYVKIQCENLDAFAGIEIEGVEFAGLVKNVTDGYYTMSAELIRLKRQISSLERRLRGAHKEYRTLASQYAVSKDSPIYSERARFALDEESESGSGKTHEELVVDAATLYDLYRGQRELNNEVSTALQRGVEAREKIVRMMGWEPATQPPELSPSGDKSGSSDDQGPSNSSDTSYGHHPDKSFPLARGNAVGERPMKTDNSSAPGCPFAATGGRKPSNHPSVSTPIPSAPPLPTRPRSLPNASGPPDSSQTTHSMAPPRAVEVEPSTSQAVSVTGSASKCPIRFLDQYSPEQVAQYFQEHKHEVPRSHEICVRRFQTNTESVRHLDAKYGNIVNMIQGLGAKHQPLLPTNEDGKDEALFDSGDGKVIERVESWAENVNGIELDAPIGESADEVKVGEGERENHFERDLKEVRLGESPSRPWGIQIPLQDPIDFDGPDEAPVTGGINQRSSAHETNPIASQVKRDSPNKATFDGHDVHLQQNAAFLPWQKSPPPASPNGGELRPQSERLTPQMVFTGPVFIGHSVEQAAEILRMSGLGGDADKKKT